jgi:hypothetical protein
VLTVNLPLLTAPATLGSNFGLELVGCFLRFFHS